MKIKHYLIEFCRRTGDGQSTCRRCTELGKFYLCWDSWFYAVLIDGEPLEGCFCYEHALETVKKLEHDLNGDNEKEFESVVNCRPVPLRFDGSPVHCPYDVCTCKHAGRDCFQCNPFDKTRSYFVKIDNNKWGGCK